MVTGQDVKAAVGSPHGLPPRYQGFRNGNACLMQSGGASWWPSGCEPAFRANGGRGPDPCSGDREPTRGRAAKPARQDCGAREPTLRPDPPKTDK